MDDTMAMYFDTGTQVTLLFKTWRAETIPQFLGTLLIVTCVAFASEAIKFWKRHVSPRDWENTLQELRRRHLFRALIHVVQVTLTYLLMLIAMSFNVWVVLAILTGSSLGYLVFGGSVGPAGRPPFLPEWEKREA